MKYSSSNWNNLIGKQFVVPLYLYTIEKWDSKCFKFSFIRRDGKNYKGSSSFLIKKNLVAHSINNGTYTILEDIIELW